MARKEERAKKREEMLAAKMQAGDQSDGGEGMSGSDKDSKAGSKRDSKDGSDSKNKTGSKRSGSGDDSGSQS